MNEPLMQMNDGAHLHTDEGLIWIIDCVAS